MNIFRLLLIFLWIVWLVYWQISALKAKRTIRGNNWRQGVSVRIAIFIVVILFLRVPVLYQFVLNIHSESFYANPLVGAIGLIISLFGFALSIWARVNLGRNWGMPTAIKEKPELVTSGPYAFVRHPIYTGMIIAMVGTTLVITIFWVIPFVFISAYFIYSLRIEEKNMMQQFPKEYKEYIQRTKALIPFIY